MNKVLACIIAIVLVFLIPFKVLATDYNFPPTTDGQIADALSRIVPVRFLESNPLFFVISIKEDVTGFFKPSSAKKAEFEMIVCGKRIKEAYTLSQKSDVKNTSRALKLYSDRVDAMINQLKRARSQNQDTENLVGEMAENLRIHETLLAAINHENIGDAYDFSANFDAAVSAHTKAVFALNDIQPGIKDRFVLTKEASVSATPAPSPSPYLEATPSVKPKRIIY
ncbi:MAG TPA: hypothetical protein VLE91_04430 [Candidatus Saccharimonadales bacterium]|nr:hypothetical protein [Candidatus Saccharimonadales bacterium]